MKDNLRMVISAVILLLAFPALAEDIPQQGFFNDISLHGFLQGNYSADAAHSNPGGADFKLAEERLQLKLEASKGPFHLFLKTDAFYDHVINGPGMISREGYLDFTASKWDARIGRQVLTWGVGDLIFINDVFPKDYKSFFSGRPLEYLKDGVDGAKIGIYPGFASFELVAIPFFTRDILPSPHIFWMFNPPILPSNITNEGNDKPSISLKNTQIALRAYREIAGFDASIYFYRGFFGQPSLIPKNPAMPMRLTLLFPELSEYGASLQGKALGGVLSLEVGYYDSRDAGMSPTIPRSQIRSLVGYQRQLWEDFTVEVQYYRNDMNIRSEFVMSLPSGFPVDDSELITIRLTQFLKHQTMRLSFFAFYNPSGGDYMLIPEIKYSFSDHVWGAIGANIFGGRKATQFGQFNEDDNIYTQLRYEF